MTVVVDDSTGGRVQTSVGHGSTLRGTCTSIRSVVSKIAAVGGVWSVGEGGASTGVRSAAYCEAVRGTLLGGVGDVCLRRRNSINCWDIFANLTDSSFQKVSVKISNLFGQKVFIVVIVYVNKAIHRAFRWSLP